MRRASSKHLSPWEPPKYWWVRPPRPQVRSSLAQCSRRVLGATTRALRDAAPRPEDPGEESRDLHRLSEAHVVREDAAAPQLLEGPEPLDPDDLVGVEHPLDLLRELEDLGRGAPASRSRGSCEAACGL